MYRQEQESAFSVHRSIFPILIDQHKTRPLRFLRHKKGAAGNCMHLSSLTKFPKALLMSDFGRAYYWHLSWATASWRLLGFSGFMKSLHRKEPSTVFVVALLSPCSATTAGAPTPLLLHGSPRSRPLPLPCSPPFASNRRTSGSPLGS